MQGRLLDGWLTWLSTYLSGLHHDLALPYARFRQNTGLNVVPSFNNCASRSASNGREITVLPVWISKKATLKGTTLIRRQVLLLLSSSSSSSLLLLLRREKFIPEMSMPYVNLHGLKKCKKTRICVRNFHQTCCMSLSITNRAAWNSRTGSDVTYSCYHNSTRSYFLLICAFVAFLCLIHYHPSHRVYINRRHRYVCLIWS
jgi:hypothetical protein